MYACLVCGKYFQGRGRNTHAYTHSVQHGHHVFINLRTCRVYCLPDSYEVVDSSLEDIQRALDPRYSAEGIAALDKVQCGAVRAGVRGVACASRQRSTTCAARAAWLPPRELGVTKYYFEVPYFDTLSCVVSCCRC